MGILNLIKRVGNTVRNDVVAPVQRDVLQPVHTFEQAAVANVERPVVKAWQTINPNSGYNQAKPIVSAAQSQYGFTPQFSSIVNGGNPSLAPQFGRNDLLSPGSTAMAQFDNSNPVNQIQMAKQGNSPDSLVHEALHREWQINPNDHSNFTSAYNAGASPELRSYLASRLGDYKQFGSGPVTQLMNVNQADPGIQDEIHSYIPQYYASKNQAIPGPLARYYGQFFNPAGTQTIPVRRNVVTPPLPANRNILDMLSKH